MGLSSLPSTGKSGNVRVNGFEVNKTKSKKPMLIIPMIPNTRATASCGKCLLNKATAAPQSVNNQIQSNNEPSCEPQTADKR